MAIADNITLDAATGTDVIFNLVSKVGQTSTRLDIGTTLAEPRELFISHTKSSDKAGVTTDRHLVSFRHTKINSKGEPLAVVVNTSIAVPRDVVFTNSMVKDLMAVMLDFFQDGTMTTWATSQNCDDILRNAI